MTLPLEKFKTITIGILAQQHLFRVYLQVQRCLNVSRSESLKMPKINSRVSFSFENKLLQLYEKLYLFNSSRPLPWINLLECLTD